MDSRRGSDYVVVIITMVITIILVSVLNIYQSIQINNLEIKLDRSLELHHPDD